MKNLKTLIIMVISGFFGISDANSKPNKPVAAAKSFYEFKMKDIEGNLVDFSSFKGKKVLIVNVASYCGFTKQYKDLEELHEEYGKKLTIIGFPANNFGGQEPGTNKEIASFCSKNYGVKFQMFEKISVKGGDAAPLYLWLSTKDQNGWNEDAPSWNFCKYLINEKGELIKFFKSSVNPMSSEIIDLLN